MTILWLILGAAATLGFSGVPALFGSRRARAGQRLTVALMVLGSVAGLAGVAWALATPPPALTRAWGLPLGQFAVAFDALGAVFLLPVFVVPALGALYGLSYWKQTEHPANGRKLGLVCGLLAGAMVLVVLARDSVLFLVAWEVMALAAFFAATADDDDAEVRRAGWIYLVATHMGTLCLMALFALLRHVSGSTALQPVAAGLLTSAAASTIFILAMVGFGFKAGLVPLHVWLPGAHANAPSHVSAILSGVMLKMGIYGIVRTLTLLPMPPSWWGGLLLGLGATTGVLGIAFAVGQQDLKRLLAYSSIENIGIIAMGLGLGLLGHAHGRPDWIALGLGGALLHVWNHSLFKSLLFFNAGAILHVAHTREIDRLGGLGRSMPRTAALFLLGAAAICALPPLNGFAGEWLLYLGLFRTVDAATGSACPAAALGAAALALIGALAAACFCKLFGTVFLGEPRGPLASEAHDPPAGMTLSMAALGLGCLTLGILPGLALPLLDRAIAVWSALAPVPAAPLATLAPVAWISRLALALIVAGSLAGLLLRRVWRRRPLGRTGTWDCGYARPTARMQYTGSSFGLTLVELFSWALRPRTERPALAGIFPRVSRCRSRVPDTVLDRLVLPLFRQAERLLPRVRLLQQGRIQVYVLYFVAVTLFLLFLGRFEGRS